jgi:hypothetical protein
MYESCGGDEVEMAEQNDRIAEYEQRLLKSRLEPMLPAMFLLYFLLSVSLISLVAYWLFF